MTMMYAKTRRWMLLGASGLACLAGGAQAQSSDDQVAIDEVIVTAQRRAERLQEVPLAVTAVGGQRIADAGLASATDIVNQVPNLQANNIFGNTTPLFTLRGVANTEFNSSANTPIPVYSDEMLLNNVAAQGFALFDLDRVEVLKGPQGTLFGYNASAGIIHFVSKRPTATPEGRLFLSYGSFNERVATGHVSGPVLGETVRGRLAFTARDSDGQFRNLADGERLGEDERWAVRGLLEFDLGGDTEAVVKAQTGRYRGDPTIRATEQDVQPLTGERLGGVYEGRFETQIFENVRATEISLRLTHHFDGFDLNTLSGYLGGKSHLFFNYVDGSQVGVLDLGYGAGPVRTPFYGVQGVRNESDQFTQELRLSSTTEGPLQWIAGAFYMREHLDSTVWFLGGDDSGAFGYLDGAPAVFVAADEFTQKIESTALFAHTTWQATEQLKFTLAGRISRDVRKLDQDFYNYDGATTYTDIRTADPYDLAMRDVIDLSGVDRTTLKRSWDLWSGQLGVDYRVDADKLVYASVSRGVKSGAFNTQAFIDVAEINAVDPETLWAYELGAKTEWLDRRLRLNGSLFLYEVDGYHQKIVTPVGQELLQPADKVEFWGLEVEARANPVRGLFVDVGVGYSKGQYKDFVEITATGPQSRDGNTVPYSGRWDANVSVSYTWPLPADAGDLETQVEYSYLQAAYTEPSNLPKLPSLSPEAKTDDIHQVGARLFYTLPGQRIRLGAFANNIFKEDGVLRRGPLAFFGNTSSIYAPRRTVGISVDATF